MMLIGQAPGKVETVIRRPFQGRAGRELFRWLRSVGIEEEEFRARVYMTAITKCFPGPARSGSGDRRPSGPEIALCRPYLEAQLRLIAPRAILLVGGLAIERYFPRTPLAGVIGHRFDRDGTTLIPLPHPSGASRWLNVPAHRDLLTAGLDHVRQVWDDVVACTSHPSDPVRAR
jgi:uracil-DNA glycosylase